MHFRAIRTARPTGRPLADQPVTNVMPTEQADAHRLHDRVLTFTSLQQFSNYRFHGATLPKSGVIQEAFSTGRDTWLLESGRIYLTGDGQNSAKNDGSLGKPERN